MNRLIPGKTKVQVELFRGVTVGDVVVSAVALAMVLLVLLSALPHKLGVCIAVVSVAALLLVRIDERANYVYLLGVLAHFAYDRRFGRLYTDEMLLRRAEGKAEDAAFDELFDRKKRAARRVKKDAEKSAEKTADASERKAREQQRREEDKILKSASADEEEKKAIRARRAAETTEKLRALAAERDAARSRKPMGNVIAFTGVRDGFIEYGGSYFGGVLEIEPVEFRFFSEGRRRNSIENCMGRILRSLHAGYSANIVKLERPVMYDDYLAREREKLAQLTRSFESGMLSEDEYKVRVEIEYDRISELESLCYERRIVDPFYYLVLFESDKRQLDMMLKDAEANLRQGELNVRRLDTKELAVFLKYSNQLDFDEREADNIRPEDYAEWAMPQTVDVKMRRVEINHIVTHNFRVVNYPSVVGDAYLAGMMSMPATKVVVKCRPMDREKAVRGIDRSLMELRGQWSATGVDSRRLEIEEHLNTLQELLGTLQGDNEVLLECNVYVTAYDIASTRADARLVQPGRSDLATIADMKKNVRRTWQEQGFRLNNMEFEQMEAFIGSQISAYDPKAKQGRGIPSNTVAACYPWIFAHISDPGGILLGESAGVPVFIDFFRRDSERVNSNMVIVGKSGSGKSYATKSLLVNLAAEDAKIFILDPENEYAELAANLHGKFINVGNAQYGRLNPFHIITALDDDEAGEGAKGGSYATHLQFLEEFFRQILPDCDKDALEYLNTMVDRVYSDRDITPETDLSKLTPEDYPIFDDLYETIVEEFQQTDNQYLRTMLRTLMNYVAKFSTGGRNANIWNGPSSVTTEENFTVFNFQSMLANRNTAIANAQMLLVLKYIDNEIIKNREYNMKYGLKRKVVVVIDEAHVFIDTKFPIALDFMFQLAKRIRKYNGMQIVITQNIKDFVGSEEIARKSTAIINACQYSFVFALAPNDIQDLVKLYEKAGGINESEQEQITQAPRGQAFTIMSPTSRSTFRVETPGAMTQMFEQRTYESHYFADEEGRRFWEEFAARSRALRAQTLAAEPERLSLPQRSDAMRSDFFMEEVSGEEYDNTRAAEDDGFAFVEEVAAPETHDDAPAARHADIATLPPDAPAFGGVGAEAITRLTEALGQFSMDAVRSEVNRAVDERMLSAASDPDTKRLLDELSELRRRNEELERRLRAQTSQETQPVQETQPAQETQPVQETQPAQTEYDDPWADIWGAPAEPTQSEEPTQAAEQTRSVEPTAQAAEPEQPQEEAPVSWSDLWGKTDDKGKTDSWSDSWDDWEIEDEPDASDAGGVRLSWGDYDPGRATGARDAKDSDDILSRAAKLTMGLSLFERMIAGGQQVMDITLDDLTRQIERERSA